MFEVKISHAYSGTVFRFITWDEATTFAEFVLGCGIYEVSDKEPERLSVTISEVPFCVPIKGGTV